MTIQKTSQWWIRTDGNDLNGAGFDSAISGAGTNYSDQSAPQLSRTDFATSGVGSTTLTSGGGFTSAMVGNSIRLSAGTNLTLGDYFIVGYTSSTQVTLDRSPDNGGGGVFGATGRVGGAWRQLELTCTNASTPCPNPVVAGNTINLAGDGSLNPTTQQYSFSGFRTFGSGNTTDGNILLKGYNGMPHIGTPSGSWLWHYNSDYWDFYKIKITANSSGNGNSFGLVNSRHGVAYQCHFVSNGFTGIGARSNVYNCLFDYSGTPATNNSAYNPNSYGYACVNSVFKNHTALAGAAIQASNMASIRGNLIIDCTDGILFSNQSQGYHTSASGNTIVNADVGIDFNNAMGMNRHCSENLLSNCTTGIKAASGTPAASRSGCFRNYLHNCGTNYQDIAAGEGDVILTDDPFVDSGGGDYSIASSSAAFGVDVYDGLPNYSQNNFRNIGAIGSTPVVDTSLSQQAGTQVFPFNQWATPAVPEAILHPLRSS